MRVPLGPLAPGVLVAVADFMITTTTVVVARDHSCLVVDPAVTVADLRALAANLRARGLAAAAGFATHSHWDHVLWSAELGAVPRYASAATEADARRLRDTLIGETRAAAPGHDPGLIGRLAPLPAGASGVPWDGPETRLVIHDGHAAGHTALFLPAAGVLLAGDMCSDAEIPLLDLAGRDPIGDYRAGLARLADMTGLNWVVPGHGSPGDTAEFRRRVAADLRYLDALERGDDLSDPRLTSDWLRETHQAQLSYARSR